MITSFKELIEESIRKTFEKIMFDEIDRIKVEAQKKLDKFTEEQKRLAKETANKMALEMLHKMNQSGISIELKL